MYQEQLLNVGFKFWGQIAENYTNLMFGVVDQNVKFFERISKGEFLQQAPVSSAPSENLQKQVEFLNQRVSTLEKTKKASLWKSSAQNMRPTY
jgi:hypothetical protein